jgi:nucleoside phosphorylase
MDTNKVTLIVLDTEKNFYAQHTQDRIGKELYKKVVLVKNRQDFEKEYQKQENYPFLFVCHVFHAEDEQKQKHSGYKKLRTSGIEEHFNLKAVLVSSGDSGDVMKNIYDKEHDTREVHSYIKVFDNIRDEKFTLIDPALPQGAGGDFNVEFGIITALYDLEFEEVQKLIDWGEPYETEMKKYRIGTMKCDPTKKVVAAVPSKTGMVDSSIIATQMLELFKPKYLLMSGVCGGKKSLGFGDIVLASKVYTFQKGKVSDLTDKKGKPLKTFDQSKNKIDLTKVYDSDQQQIHVTVENFEREEESEEIDSRLQDELDEHRKRIQDIINEPYKLQEQKITVHFEPMACSTMVINKNGYFEQQIKALERKTVAVEMESFGVARACRFANDGKTKWVIFKSVMDNMTKKTDEAKEFAAYTSAQFLRHLICDGILK